MHLQSSVSLPPVQKMFKTHSTSGPPGSSQVVRRHILADITNTSLSTVATKTKSKTGRRRSERFSERLDYSEPTVAQIYQMSDEEIINEMRRHAYTSSCNGPNASDLERVEVPALPAVIDLTSTPDDVRPKGQGATTQDGGHTKLVILRMGLEKLQQKQAQQKRQQQQQQKEQNKLGDQLDVPHPAPRPIDHPVLRLEALLCKLDKNKANQAQQVFGLIRDNLKEGQDAKGLIEHVIRLFESVKHHLAEDHDRLSNNMAQVEQEMQRVAENRDRLSNDKAQVEQEMQLFDDVDFAADDMDIDG